MTRRSGARALRGAGVALTVALLVAACPPAPRLPAGTLPHEATTTGRSLGPEDAPTVLVLFGDYGCGPCARHGRRLRPLLEARSERVRLVYHHCPSRRHATSLRAAIAAEAAADQGRFWELHFLLVEAGPVHDDETLGALVAEAGLDADRLAASIATGRPEAAVEADLRLADRIGLRGTPTTFVGSVRLDGAVSARTLAAALDGAR